MIKSLVKFISKIFFLSIFIFYTINTMHAPITHIEIESDPIKQKIINLSLREKVGQLFVIVPEALTSSSQSVDDSMKKIYAQYPAGGFALFAKNISNPDQLMRYTKDLHELNTTIKPFVCVDEEGDIVARLANNPKFDLPRFGSMNSIAMSKDTSKAYNVGNSIGDYLAQYGFDVDFAPVADVNTNPKNPVIGNRAFGNDPYLAGEMVAKVLEGLHRHGVYGCIKHFPGHGDTSTDTHIGAAQTLKTWEQMKKCEMIPFCKGVDANAKFVMIAHISAPNVTGNNEPASVSRCIVTDKLRNEIGYNGVIITDSFSMGGITNQYTSAEATVKAIKAGVDIVLMPQNYIEAFDAVIHAVQTGEIDEKYIDESVYRILSLKN